MAGAGLCMSFSFLVGAPGQQSPGATRFKGARWLLITSRFSGRAVVRCTNVEDGNFGNCATHGFEKAHRLEPRTARRNWIDRERKDANAATIGNVQAATAVISPSLAVDEN